MSIYTTPDRPEINPDWDPMADDRARQDRDEEQADREADIEWLKNHPAESVEGRMRELFQMVQPVTTAEAWEQA